MPPIASPDLPIDDELLQRLIPIATAARQGRAAVADALLLVEVTPAVLAELLVYRRCLGAQFGADLTNVTRLTRHKARLRCGAGPELGGAA